jgi:phosphonate transport system permease protein
VLVVASFVSLDLDWAAFASMEAARSMAALWPNFSRPICRPCL